MGGPHGCNQLDFNGPFPEAFPQNRLQKLAPSAAASATGQKQHPLLVKHTHNLNSRRFNRCSSVSKQQDEALKGTRTRFHSTRFQFSWFDLFTSQNWTSTVWTETLSAPR